MPENIYEVIALGARYWFIFLGALIVLRTFGWLRRDRKDKHKRLRPLQDAGMIGRFVVLQGEGELMAEMVMPVPREGVLGSIRSCDLVVPGEAVAPQHCDFSFVPGEGVVLRPRRHCAILVDDEEVTTTRAGRKHPLHPGSRLQIGDTILELQVFRGIDAGAPVLRVQQPEFMPTPMWQQQPAGDYREPFQWQVGEQYPLYGQQPMMQQQNPMQQPVYQPQQTPNAYQQPLQPLQQPVWTEEPNGWMSNPTPVTPPQEPSDDGSYGYTYPRRNRRARRGDDA